MDNEVVVEVYFVRGNVDKTLREQKYIHRSQIQVQESVMDEEGIITLYDPLYSIITI